MGWSQYYSFVVSKKIFNTLDSLMHRKLWKWAVFRHPKKGKCWIKRKYFKKHDKKNWRFMANDQIYLVRHDERIIKRHVKVKENKSPYDNDWTYWANRLKRSLEKPLKIIKLLKWQQGKCNYCQLWLKNDDNLKVHHKDHNKSNNIYKNLSLLHEYCYNYIHKKCAW